MTGTRRPESPEIEIRPASERVLEAVAEETAADPLEFEQPLADAIDADALDALFRRDDGAAAVEFTYLGYLVQVSADDSVSVRQEDR